MKIFRISLKLVQVVRLEQSALAMYAVAVTNKMHSS